jgi:hypothetical protein
MQMFYDKNEYHNLQISNTDIDHHLMTRVLTQCYYQ